MNIVLFEERLFKDFIYCEIKKDAVIYDLNQNIDYIYLIIEGEIEITINNSILWLMNKIKDLAKISHFKGLKDFDYRCKNKNSKCNIFYFIVFDSTL